MSITQLAIDKNRITALVIFIIIFGGLIAFNSLPRSEDPGFTIRTAFIMTMFPGASPDRIENLITDKLEKVIQQIPELDFVTSESKTGASIIYVQIKSEYKEMRPIWDNLRRKIEGAKTDLPEGIIGPFVNDEFGEVFGIQLTITGEGYSYAELKEVADQIRDELLRIEDVAKVNIYGAQEERIFVEFNNARLAQLGLSPAQLEAILGQRNILFPGGNITTGDERIALEPTGNFETIEELRKTVISIPGKTGLLYLEDIAEVYRGYIDPPKTLMRSSGVPCLGIGISMREAGNIIKLGEDVKAAVSHMQAEFPIGIEFETIFFQPQDVEKSINEFVRSLLQAIAIVIAVMLITLGFRTGLVVAGLMPTVILMSILIMKFFGIGLNTMSLVSLIISLGLLVDNAIVMSESIMVQIEAGKEAVKSAIDSAAELRTPLLISSLTTAAAFLPIFLAKSDTGEYTNALFKVVTITLLCSWTLALTMTPILCVKFLKIKKNPKKAVYNSNFYKWYRRSLIMILKHRAISLIAIIAVFFGAMQLSRFIPGLFFPHSDKSFFRVELILPKGTPVNKTASVVAEVEKFIIDSLKINDDRAEGVVKWASFIGRGAPRYYLSANPQPEREEYSILLLRATSREAVDDMIPRLEKIINENFTDAIAKLSPLDYGPPVMAPIQIRLSGRDPGQLFAIVDSVKTKLKNIVGTKNIDDDWGAWTKKLIVNINQPRARRAGVTNLDIALSLQTILSGIEISQFREDDKAIPITLRADAADRHDIGKLETLDIYSQTTGRSVPLKQVADIEVFWEPSKILRRDRLKTVTVEAYLQDGVTATEITNQLTPYLDEIEKDWPLGYIYEYGGEMESSIEAQASIMVQLPIALAIIILLLVGQFNSFRRPLIILSTIPMALIGVNIGLIITGQSMGFMTFLGVISLAGIVINNAIVMIDRIRIECEEYGLKPQQAIIVSAQKRLRPILLTTATTIGGLTPLWIGGGPLWESMAVAIIFGLLFATVLTLGLVPLLYSLFFRVRFKGYQFKN
jgi:multidrug efflux pump subunit AcrB